MAPFASHELVGGLWRPLTDVERARVTLLLGSAARIIRQAVPSVDDRIAAGTLDAELVADVSAQMVIRVMRNPEGLRSVTRAIDDFTTTETRDQALSDGTLRLLDEELRSLQARGSRAFSIAPAEPPCSEAITEQVAANRAGWGR